MSMQLPPSEHPRSWGGTRRVLGPIRPGPPRSGPGQPRRDRRTPHLARKDVVPHIPGRSQDNTLAARLHPHDVDEPAGGDEPSRAWLDARTFANGISASGRLRDRLEEPLKGPTAVGVTRPPGGGAPSNEPF
jgi:hypothetical protein